MLMVREQNQIRRIRLSFNSTTDAAAFYERLSLHVSVKQSNPSRTSLREAKDGEELAARVSRWLDRMLPAEGSSVAAVATFADPAISAAWQTEWPTSNLSHLIKLCLLDPNFPGFVRQVHEALQKTINNDEDDDDKENRTGAPDTFMEM